MTAHVDTAFAHDAVLDSAGCAACGAGLVSAAAFCGSCGHRRGAPVSPAETVMSPLPTAPSVKVSLTLQPLIAWAREPGFWRGWVGPFALFAVAPFALLQASGETESRVIATGFAVYFALLWGLVLHRVIAPEPQDRWLLVRISLFTAFVGTALAIAIEEWVLSDAPQLPDYVFGVGLPEEAVKALPVLLFVFLSRRSWTPRTFIFAGVVSGLTFGAVEAISYTGLYEQLSDLGAGTYGDMTAATIWRLLSGGLFHGCLAGVLAYFIGLAYWYRRSAVVLVALGLGLVSVLHGLYDDLSGGWLGTAVAGFTIVVFAAYVRIGDEIALRLGEPDQQRPAALTGGAR
ncbi:PrsW family glutamic-type intramembrane protease [Quadrisphaera oryzae]|uniref:PrsW family glutamic-type intramembrane protease n=1 Tax=Quadrisphaera oryzae TaxID=2509661 RepID=UPI0019914469|nr:PrsW family intramembrane metalloprotease [Quadrisphaera sp. RL12-1S]